ncbi:MAG: hypothetical protein JNK67_26450 [Alphaproteobacteria bacterium]|nr:hypothetical protein [Alphaproteobacteria bacterium]
MRTIGWLLIVFGVVILGRDCARWLEFQYFAPTPLGQIWYLIHPASLNTFQAFIERYVAIWLWQEGFGVALRWPAWISLPALGTVIVGIARLHEAEQKKQQAY